MTLEGLDVNWMDEFNGAITVCNREGIIVYMNNFSIHQFDKRRGKSLIGSNLLDCHPEPSKTKLKQMLKQPSENIYTREKHGQKKIIVQKPWINNGKFKGIVEISFELPKNETKK
jgi:transcriptional regulator with PAS, ATPase and Fis domain